MHITDRLSNSRWGVFTHYLWHTHNNPDSPHNLGAGRTSWSECTDSIDVKKLAASINAAGAHYYFITVMQGMPYLLAPNRTFDEIAGTRPGEYCAERDVILELIEELKKYNIDLYLYFTGDGPYKDNTIGGKFGFTEPRSVGITLSFVEKWAAVLEEYAVRYGDGIKGWWIDGCYRDFLKYDDTTLEPYYRAVKKGNPNAVVTMNNGVKPYFAKNYKDEDFVAGEFNDFFVIPRSRFIDGAQAFVLAPLGISPDGSEWGAWGRTGLKRDADYLRNYIRCVNSVGGVVTIDIAIDRDGGLDPVQVAELAKLEI